MLSDPQLDVPAWTFLTNHAHVLIAIARDSELRQRDIAHVVDITPGAVVRILHDLEEKTVQDVCDLTGWGTSKVKVTAMRARRKLSEQLKKLEPDH